MIRITITFLFSCFFATAYGQDTILMMSGKTIVGKVLDVNETSVSFEEVRKGKTQKGLLDAYRIFSVTQGGKEFVLYQADTSNSADYTQDEMRYFVYGERDAHKGFKAPLTTIIGSAVGAAGGIVVSTGGFPFLASPFVYSSIFLIPNIRIDRSTVSNEEYLLHETYVMGYERVARNKKVQNALKGSLVGMVAGIIAGVILELE